MEGCRCEAGGGGREVCVTPLPLLLPPLAPPWQGSTALHRAAQEGHTEALQALLEHGADTTPTTKVRPGAKGERGEGGEEGKGGGRGTVPRRWVRCACCSIWPQLWRGSLLEMHHDPWHGVFGTC